MVMVVELLLRLPFAYTEQHLHSIEDLHSVNREIKREIIGATLRDVVVVYRALTLVELQNDVRHDIHQERHRLGKALVPS